MRLKVHFFNLYLEFFPGNLVMLNEEQDKSFHQAIKEVERQYEIHWTTRMMTDFCKVIHKDAPEKKI